MGARLKKGLGAGVPVALAAGVLLVPGALAAGGQGQGQGKSKSKSKATPVHRVYSETNGANDNQVVIFNRAADGTLKQIGAVSTGGKGGLQGQPGCNDPCPLLDTQGEVQLAAGKKLLFAVNAGSNTITSFRVTSKGLQRASVIPSGGVFPNSLTVHGKLLYVLNTNSLNIAGFRFGPQGKLSAIKGSTQSLVGAPPGLARQIGFDNKGRTLLVTLLANKAAPPPAITIKDTIDVFPVSKKGVAGKAKTADSGSPGPFGFAFDARNRAVVSELHDLSGAPNGQTSVLGLTKSGGLKPIDTQPSNGALPCWVAISKDSRFVYVVNTGGGAPTGATVTVYRLSKAGKLKRIQVTKALNEFARTDEALSADGKYLYVVSPVEGGSASAPGPTSHIDEYRVRPDGTLTYIGQTASLALPGLSGIAAS